VSGLSVRGLSLRYAGAAGATLHDVSFDVAAGTLTALLGPSGCGKTSVLRVLAGLVAPDAGRVLLEGEDITARPPEDRSVGLVFQSYALFPHLSALGNVLFALEAAGQGGPRAAAQAEAALRGVGLQAHADARPAQLSGGQQQRAALARALVLAPRLLLLDEPLSSIDPVARRSVREEIRALQRSLGCTVVYVTHDHREALAVSDRVVLMNEGRVAQAGAPRELYEQPADEFVAGFMGEASLLPATRDAQARLWLGSWCVAGLWPGSAGPVRLAIRPEAWRLHPASGHGLAASVLKHWYLGRVQEYLLATPVGRVRATAPASGPALAAGAPVSLTLAEHGVSVLSAAA
jgi:iron(III) transport system ATP-binding protein